MPMLYLKLKITFFIEKPAFKLKYDQISTKVQKTMIFFLLDTSYAFKNMFKLITKLQFLA